MHIAALQTYHFRNLADGAVSFSPELNLFVGPNGQGKTNLLEAMYCACFSKSFRTHRLEECVAHGEAELRTACRVEREPLPRVLEVRLDRSGKELRLDGKAAGIDEFLASVSLLCITADHLRVITEGPEQRRRFLDGLIVLFWPEYLHELATYRRVVRQKNALLRAGEVVPAVLEPWNRRLAQTARPVVARRLEFLRLLESVGGRDRFSGDPFRVRYHPSLEADLLADESRAVAALEAHREREQALQRSLYGPHLDRFDFYLADRNVRHYASSGQKRGALLTVYLDVMDLFQQARGHLPVVIIDDVDMELDLPRIRTLLDVLDRRAQLFLSSAKPELFQDLLPGRTACRIDAGRVYNI